MASERKVDSFALQLNGRTELILAGELRDNLNRYGPGGILTVVHAGPGRWAKPGDRLLLIALPDAPPTTNRNPAAAEAQRRERPPLSSTASTVSVHPKGCRVPHCPCGGKGGRVIGLTVKA